MNSLFCSNCGTKLFFSGKRPDKCSGCGKGFAETTAAVQPRTQPITPTTTEGDYVPNITRAQIDVEINTVKPMSLKDHWVSSMPDEEALIRDAPELPEGEAFLQQTLEECKPTQKSTDVGE